MNTTHSPTITQAMILAAGKGTRMRPLTLSTPKPLVMVAGKPLIVWHIDKLKAAGVRDITINLGYLGKVLQDALSAIDLGVRLRFSDETEFDEPLETAGGIKYALAQGHLADDDFLLINGDVWSEVDYAVLSQHQLTDEALAHLLLTPNPEHNPLGDFQLHGVFAKPKVSAASLAHTFSGLSVLSPRLFDHTAVGVPSKLAPVLAQAMEANRVTASLTEALWVDVGTIERLAWINDYITTKNKSI